MDFTSALARVAKVLGYRVTVCDAREVFATKRRFPMADDIMVAWPDEVFAAHGAALGAATRYAFSRTTPNSTCPPSKVRCEAPWATSA